MLDTLVRVQNVRMWLFLIALYLGCFVASCGEFKYLIWGETTHATVTEMKLKKVVGGRRGPAERLAVKYTFTQEDGTPRKGTMKKDLDWAPDPDGTFAIEYLPDKYQAERLPGTSNKIGVAIFVVMTGVIVFYLVIIAQQAHK